VGANATGCDASTAIRAESKLRHEAGADCAPTSEFPSPKHRISRERTRLEFIIQSHVDCACRGLKVVANLERRKRRNGIDRAMMLVAKIEIQVLRLDAPIAIQSIFESAACGPAALYFVIEASRILRRAGRQKD